MAPNEPEILRDRGRSLEDEFFRRQDKQLLQRLADLNAARATREELAKASGITDPAVLDRLTQLGIRAQTVAALALVPLVEVAWADGSLDARERRAIVERAEVAPDSTAGALLEGWLGRQPDAALLDAWTLMIRAMAESLPAADVARLKAGLLDRARAVAAATGGVLGLGSKVSASEAEMLARLEAAFP